MIPLRRPDPGENLPRESFLNHVLLERLSGNRGWRATHVEYGYFVENADPHHALRAICEDYRDVVVRSLIKPNIVPSADDGYRWSHPTQHARRQLELLISCPDTVWIGSDDLALEGVIMGVYFLVGWWPSKVHFSFQAAYVPRALVLRGAGEEEKTS